MDNPLRATNREGALVVLRQGMDRREWVLAGFLSIGRDESCDVRLSDRSVSRLHATLRQTAKGYVIEDEGSKNGTFVNGERVAGTTLLTDGDEISVAARYKLYFVDADATAPIEFQGRGLRIDADSLQVFVNGVVVEPPLSSAQFDLLRLLAEADGAAVHRDSIVARVWPDSQGLGVSEEAVDALVRRLRTRLAEYDPDRTLIVTVRGFGFRLESD